MDHNLIPFSGSPQQLKLLEIRVKASSTKKRLVKTWTTQEDQRLVALYEMHPKKWNIISQKMKNRNQNQCLHRFRRICRLGQSKKIWSPHQDQVVLKMIKQVGHNWRLIAQQLGTKSGKQIRQRFINKLDPNIRRQQWTQQEDMKIIQLYSRMGSKWCEISKCLPGRPENRIKNRFYSYIQKNYDFKIREEESNGLANKENLKHTAGIKVVMHSEKSGFFEKSNQNSQKQPLAHQRRPSQVKVLQERVPNKLQKIQVVKKEEKKQEVSWKKIDEEKENNQYNNSLKQINEECFYKYSENVNNTDLLYFEDN